MMAGARAGLKVLACPDRGDESGDSSQEVVTSDRREVKPASLPGLSCLLYADSCLLWLRHRRAKR